VVVVTVANETVVKVRAWTEEAEDEVDVVVIVITTYPAN
jgi:hypothetical protein